MNKYFPIVLFLLISAISKGQLAEVQANYNGVGDVDFVAYNNTPAPLFLNIDFADLENTTFHEPLPYIKCLQPGFNTLFTLQREPGADVPRFNYQIKIFKSNPWALVDLTFPYLIPLAPGQEAGVIAIPSLEGFLDSAASQQGHATGFAVRPGQEVYAARTGTVVEKVGNKRNGEPQTWYHTWNNSVTVLQPDGTLLCYRNVVDPENKLQVGQRIFAGQLLGQVAPSATELIVVIYQHSLNSPDLRFIIPRFVHNGQSGLILPSNKYMVVHPKEIRSMEMTNREKRKNLTP